MVARDQRKKNEQFNMFEREILSKWIVEYRALLCFGARLAFQVLSAEDFYEVLITL
jgi:hypothetical protein